MKSKHSRNSFFKNKNANKAVKNGIAAKHNKVIAAGVLLLSMKEIIATPKPQPLIILDLPIFL